MRGIDVFCERCGARQPTERREGESSGSTLARRLVSAVSRTADGIPQPAAEMFLRLCLDCRGYSCPACWNEAAAVCQTCAPLPEIELPAAVEPEPVLAPQPAQPIEHPVIQPVAAQPDPVEQPPARWEPVAVEPVAVEPETVEPETVEPEPVFAPPVVSMPPVIPAAPPAPVLPLAAAFTPPTSAPAAPDPVVPDPVVPAPFVPPRPRPSIAFDLPEMPSLPAFAAMHPPAPSQREYLPVPAHAADPGPVGVRPCRNCQLPLSARSHFCRRCGTSQES